MIKKTIWIDIDNTPHVLFFRPIIKELEKRNYNILVTARNYGGVIVLLNQYKIKFVNIGGDNGVRKIQKIYNVLLRVFRLSIFALKNKNINLAISHGSRAQVGAARLLGIPSITSYDYEYTYVAPEHKFATTVIVPAIIPNSFFQENNFSLKNIRKYNGFKEQIYLNDFKPDSSLLRELNIDENKVIVLIRPPAFHAHYYTPVSGKLFSKLLNILQKQHNIFIIFSPRDESQKKYLKKTIKNSSNTLILEREVDGLNLIWNCDLVFSGGGTMNREAALLGVPVYSIFGGKTGLLDLELNKKNRLHFIKNEDDFNGLKFIKRDKSIESIRGNVKEVFIEEIEKLLS